MLTRVPSTLPADVEDVMHRVIGAAIEVHRHLGPGYLESTYHRALCIELRLRGIAFEGTSKSFTRENDCTARIST